MVDPSVPDYEKPSTFSCDEDDNCQLSFENGPIFTTTADENGFLEFNIRFALEPTGDLRFKSPRLIFEYGNETIDASLIPSPCLNG